MGSLSHIENGKHIVNSLAQKEHTGQIELQVKGVGGQIKIKLHGESKE